MKNLVNKLPSCLLTLLLVFAFVAPWQEAKAQSSNKWKKKYLQQLQDSVEYYDQKGLYIKSLEFLEDMMVLIKTSFDEDKRGENFHDITLRQLILAYEETGHLHKAASMYDYAIELTKQSLGEKHPDYASLLNGKGLIMEKLARYDEAIYYLEQAKNIRREIFGEESVEYAEAISNLAGIYTDLGQFQLAEEMFLKAKMLVNVSLGEEDPMNAYFIDNLAMFYEGTGNFTKAFALFQLSDSLRKNSVGSQDPLYWESLQNYGSYYFNIGEYGKAEGFYREVAEKKENYFGKQHPQSIAADWDLARLYEYMGKHTVAEEMYTDIVERFKRSIGPSNPELIQVEYELATLYFITGYHKESQKLLEHALANSKEVYGRRHPVFADGLIALAEKHFFTHDYTNAEAFYRSALGIRKDILEESHPLVASAHNDLGVLYDYMTLYEDALREYKTSLKIREDVFGRQHPDVAATMNNIGGLFLEMNQVDSAEPYFRGAMEINEQVLGKDHSFYGFALTNMAMYYKRSGNYEKAIELYKEAMAINEQELGKEHNQYIQTVRDLAHLYTAKRSFEEAYPYWDEALKFYIAQIHEMFPHLSPTDKQRFHKDMFIEYEMFYNYALLQYKSNEIVANAFQRQMESKGMIGHHESFIQQVIGATGEAGLVAKLNEWRSGKDKLAQFEKDRANQTMDREQIQLLADRVANLEVELAVIADSISTEGMKRKTVTWQDIKQELKPGEVAVQIIRFKRYMFRNQGYFIDSVYHAALIVEPGTMDAPKIVLIKDDVQNEQVMVAGIQRQRKMEESYASIYDTYWSPVENALGPDVKRIFISTDGLFDYLNYDKLKDGTGGTSVARKFDIVKLENTRQLLNLEDSGLNLIRE